MKNVFTKPVMNISAFDIEDVITTSGAGVTGTDVTSSVGVENIQNDDTYKKATASWDTSATGGVLQFN